MASNQPGLTDYHAKYFAHELTRRYPADSVEKLAAALADAQVDLNPHQVDAALFAFKSPLSRGALLADEVGLGKTIEAGLVLSQKWAERKRRVLVITPSNLRKQWYQELTEKFFLPCRILESKSYNAATKLGRFRPFEADVVVICPVMIGKRLQLARRAAGLSLRDLGARIDKLVSAQALSKYERDEMMPGADVLAAIARALGVSESYLLGQNELTLESVEFRRNKITSRKDEASIKASVLREVERYLEIEDFVGVATATWSRPQGAPFRVAEPADAEAAAMRLRSAWSLRLDPIPNLAAFLEEQGVKVIALPLGERVSGLMCVARRRKGEDVPIVIVNQGDTGERQRFTLAHELAHHVLVGQGGPKGEKLAHWFAGAFLMPAEMLWREVGKHRDSLSIGELLELKVLLKTSVQAITYRLKDLQIIGEPLFKRLSDEFEKRGWRKPPYPELGAMEPEKPERFTRLCYRAFSEGTISEAKAAELLDITVRELGRRLESTA